ncbi:MAG: hypothetical protein OJF49_002081 [Ktedonobacterales bacterium]|nr:MAG: hypothetical protein OJF49_002081 [Ktedonobacterales bacterium]
MAGVCSYKVVDARHQSIDAARRRWTEYGPMRDGAASG